ncbi:MULTISPECIES: ATP-binding protein [Streptomyces]|uniref:ATP-binding protein n=1 Tax=Streptomyces TaxID=1883 RepID=UPI00226DB740|nr:MULTISPECIES: ATP-binding protein [unclassified Streptomyces]MCY0940179.1 ATP-binding protein [Streptomyces sp. H34-AA3]MCZ4080826.1 ATP-binding protein [Streptomyces sp. H34-S5]
MHAAEVLTGLPPVSPQASCGFYLVRRDAGFTLYMSASQEHLFEMRQEVFKTVVGAGIGEEVAESAQLVASELTGNAVRACGAHVPVVVEVDAGVSGVSVKVHDPEPDRLPRRRLVALDDADAEDGRGLGLVDLLAPGWWVCTTPVGKQIVCRLPCGEGEERA